MINPQWPELTVSTTKFYVPEDVRAIEVRLYKLRTVNIKIGRGGGCGLNLVCGYETKWRNTAIIHVDHRLPQIVIGRANKEKIRSQKIELKDLANSRLLFPRWGIRPCSAHYHYENTPIQIYRKFHFQKTENLQIKKLWYFSYFCSKHRLWVLVRTASPRRF